MEKRRNTTQPFKEENKTENKTGTRNPPSDSSPSPSVQLCLSLDCRLKSTLLEPLVNYCPICLSQNSSTTCLSRRGSTYGQHSPSQPPTPERVLISPHSQPHWEGNINPKGRPHSFLWIYKDPFRPLSPGQWQESINFTMRAKDYERVCPRFPTWGRVLLVVLLMATLPLTSSMAPPPNYSQSNMPETNFTCADKNTGGYYADPEAGCQMFHVCVKISEEEVKNYRFLCPHDTVFDQQNFICTNWWDIVCEDAVSFYDKNVFGTDTSTPEYEYENIAPPVEYEYVYEYPDQETTTKKSAKIVEAPKEIHRLSLSQVQKESPKARALEVTAPPPKRHSTISTTTSTETSFLTSTSPSTVALTTARPKSSSIRTTHRLSFKPAPAINRLPTLPPPPVFHQRESFTSSRGREKPAPKVEEPEPSKAPEESQNLNLDDEDPFANYDWKRDSSGVTASARTRYEALFGRRRGQGRHSPPPEETKAPPPRPTRIRRPKPTTTTTISPFTNPPSRRRQRQGNPQAKRRGQKRTSPQSSSEARHREFSNFRFYKTAFGRSYSSDDHLGSTGTTAAPLRVSDPIRVERIASRNTRYSIYA